MLPISEGSYAMTSLGAAAADSVQHSYSRSSPGGRGDENQLGNDSSSGGGGNGGGWLSHPAAVYNHTVDYLDAQQYLPQSASRRVTTPLRAGLVSGARMPMLNAIGNPMESFPRRDGLIPHAVILSSDSASDLPPGSGIATMPARFFCKVCSVATTSETNLRDHEAGRKHQRRAQRVAELALELSEGGEGATVAGRVSQSSHSAGSESPDVQYGELSQGNSNRTTVPAATIFRPTAPQRIGPHRTSPSRGGDAATSAFMERAGSLRSAGSGALPPSSGIPSYSIHDPTPPSSGTLTAALAPSGGYKHLNAGEMAAIMGSLRRLPSGNVYDGFPCVRVGDYLLPSSMDLREPSSLTLSTILLALKAVIG